LRSCLTGPDLAGCVARDLTSCGGNRFIEFETNHMSNWNISCAAGGRSLLSWADERAGRPASRDGWPGGETRVVLRDDAALAAIETHDSQLDHDQAAAAAADDDEAPPIHKEQTVCWRTQSEIEGAQLAVGAPLTFAANEPSTRRRRRRINTPRYRPALAHEPKLANCCCCRLAANPLEMAPEASPRRALVWLSFAFVHFQLGESKGGEF
jgi:hypothetical protein